MATQKTCKRLQNCLEGYLPKLFGVLPLVKGEDKSKMAFTLSDTFIIFKKLPVDFSVAR